MESFSAKEFLGRTRNIHDLFLNLRPHKTMYHKKTIKNAESILDLGKLYI